MDNIRIHGYFTTPEYDIRVADKLLTLLEKKINETILSKYSFPKVKSKTFEIMLDSELVTNEQKVKQLSKTGRGQYFSFAFYLPYKKIVQNGIVNNSIFIQEFMEAIREALSQFNIIPDTFIDKLKEQLIAETDGKKEYVYAEPEDDKLLREIVNEVSRQFEAGELHKSL